MWLLQQRRREHKNAPLPGIPVGLSAVASAGQIDVAWPIQEGYVVTLYRGTVDDFGLSSAVQSFIDITNYIDTDVVSTTTYFYWITLSNGVGEGGESAGASAVAV